MDKKYNIQVNKSQPTPQEIVRYKNFNRVMRQYRRSEAKKPFHHFAFKLLIPLGLFLFLLFIMYYVTRIFDQQEKRLKERQRIEQTQP